MTKLGDIYRDKASGLIGMATARTEYLNDPTASVRLTPATGATAAMQEQWISEGRLEPYNDHAPRGFGS